MSTDDQEEKIEEAQLIRDFLQKEFVDNFMNAYGLNLSISDIHPEQANNELRNAIVHLSRGLLNEDCQLHVELQKAKAHIERGKRDCYKLSIIRKIDDLWSDIHAIEISEGTALIKQSEMLKRIGERKRKTYKNETLGYPVAEDYQTVLADILDLEDALHENFRKPKKLRFPIFVYKMIRSFWGLAISFIGGVLATLFILWLQG